MGRFYLRCLFGIGANVVQSARKEHDLAMIESYGIGKVRMDEIDEGIEEYDFIFNTAPAMVLDRDRLDKLKKDCLVIDLASAPGRCRL